MADEVGNSGSRTHSYGLSALRLVSQARERIAKAAGCNAHEVVFTSGATESDNLAILGLEQYGLKTGRTHIVSTAIEHKAVAEPLALLRSRGFEITLVKPSRSGHVAAGEMLEAVRPDTLLVSIMHANNETGAVQPIDAVACGLDEDGPYLHVDAAQTFGRLTGTLRNKRIDLISLSAHKFFGPKGVGALIARRRGMQRPPLAPLMVGGGQEDGLRPGTLPVPLVAGFGLAAELAVREEAQRAASCRAIRTDALAALSRLEPSIHGEPGGEVLPNILSLAVPGVDSEAVMVSVKDVAAISNGSACTSSSYQPSHVLTAMGLDENEIAETIRISWSHDTGRVDWDEIATRIEQLRL